jgi:hypothetical protein
MCLPAGSAAKFGRTGADHDPNYVRRSTQTDQNRLFVSAVWVGPLEMPKERKEGQPIETNAYYSLARRRNRNTE